MSPMPPQYGYGVAMPSMSPTVTQGSSGQLEALLRAIGVPAVMPPMQPVPPQYGGMGEPNMNFRPIAETPMTPGFMPQPVPMPEMRPEEVSTFPMPPRSIYGNIPPLGRPAQPIPYMPGSVAPRLPESRPEEVFPGPGQQTQGQGLDIQKLMAMLGGMQGKGQTIAPQAPYIPDFTMPVPEMSPADIARIKMQKAAEEAEKLRIMGEMPRMPSPSPVRPSQGNQSAMGLTGLLNAIQRSRRSAR